MGNYSAVSRRARSLASCAVFPVAFEHDCPAPHAQGRSNGKSVPLDFNFLSSQNMSRIPAMHLRSSPRALAIRIDGHAAAVQGAGGLHNVVASR
jgi:hypothetical protein